MNDKLIMLAVAVAVGGILLAVLQAWVGRRPRKGAFVKAMPLSRNEQAMYWRLVEAFPAPDFVVFGQVSFGALLRATKGASRYSFSQKRADFVLFDKSFSVRAVIELDDASHKDKQDSDARRDAMLKEAGYRVLRYRAIPASAQLIQDVAASVPTHP